MEMFVVEINGEPYEYDEEVYDLLCMMQARYPEVTSLEPCAPEALVKRICRVCIYEPDVPGLVRKFVIAGFDLTGRAVCCVVDQGGTRFL